MLKACTIFFNARSKPDTYTVPSCFHSKWQPTCSIDVFTKVNCSFFCLGYCIYFIFSEGSLGLRLQVSTV